MTKRLKTKASILALAVAGLAVEASGLYALPVLPAGTASHPVDGRDVVLHDNAAIAAAFNSKGRKVPLDVGHLTEWDGAAPAVGWVQSLFLKEDGSLWANCEMTAEGQALIDGKKFGYTSPTLRGLPTESGWQASSLKSLALTNNPALEMSATFTAEADGEDETDEEGEVVPPTEGTPEAAAAAQEGTQAVGEGSGTPENETTEPPAAEGTAALTADQPSEETVALTAARDEAQAQVLTLSAQVQSLTAQLATLATERDSARTDLAAFTTADTARQVGEAVDAHIAGGKGTPAQREQLLGFAAKDLAGFKAFSASSPVLGVFGRLATPAATDGGPAVSAEVQEYLAKHGLPLEAYQRGLS